MIDEVLEELRSAGVKAHESLQRQFTRIRTGRANPSLLDAIRVDYYGTMTPISQMATITVPEPRMLMVKPWDKTNMRALEKAIMESDLGLNPQNDGDVMRLPLPPLTEERRKDLVKVAKKNAEETRISVRKARNDCKDMIDQLKTEGDISEDDADRAKKKMEELVHGAIAQIDETLARKERDIMEV